jgi:transposase-like protein
MVKKCVFCKSSKVVKNGQRKRKVRIKQSFLCRECEKQFVEPDGFERMRYKPKDIARAIHLHNDGMSLFQVQNHLWQHDGVKVSRETIRSWCEKYGVFLKSNKKTGETKTNWAATLRRKIRKSRKKR